MKKTSLLVGIVLVNILGLLLLADSSQNRNAALAQNEPRKTSATVPDEPNRNELEITKVQEAAALAFAEMYHTELGGLLKQLKKAQPRAYAKAIRDLYSTMTKLETLREKSPNRYEIALEMWQLDSRIRLVSARMTKSSKPELERELKSLLAERLDLKLKQARQEKHRLEERLQRTTNTIKNLEQNREAEVEKDYLRIQRNLGLGPKPPKPGKP